MLKKKKIKIINYYKKSISELILHKKSKIKFLQFEKKQIYKNYYN